MGFAVLIRRGATTDGTEFATDVDNVRIAMSRGSAGLSKLNPETWLSVSRTRPSVRAGSFSLAKVL